ncbi:MAG TPA: DNA replication/repair protein RecF [Chloroflexota bacterium]|nr:DNA replication/repair protein RecF [Chloroflexota bacterium]
MRVRRLILSHFRNYARLDLAVSPGATFLWGDNAQGKSNLLEAIFYLATFRSFRATGDRDLVGWELADDPIGFCRIGAEIERAGDPQELDVILREEPRKDGETTALSKRIKLNDVPRRAIDVIGTLNAVLFSPQDLELVDGSPALRRRYLDVTISQADRPYCRALAHYNRVILQRNHLLRGMRERGVQSDQLHFWNRELVTAGTTIVERRRETIGRLGEIARRVYVELSGAEERLDVRYKCSALGTVLDAEAGAVDVGSAFEARLAELLPREVGLGVSLVGPHRDDLLFSLDGRELAAFGSRGQQRTAGLALKLAEVDNLVQQTGEAPILLLDDVFSELDPRRRERVIGAIRPDQQVLLTTTDPRNLHGFPSLDTSWLRVSRGQLEPRPPGAELVDPRR